MSVAHWTRSRRICRRIEIEGTLTLLTPAAFGGEEESITDMPLLRDPGAGRALLTGASLAGALRNALWELEMGYEVEFNPKMPEHRTALAVHLFGNVPGDPDGNQSPLIVDDALGEPPRTELRDGVKIDAKTRTAADDQKFDIELLRAGTTFPLRFELLISAPAKAGSDSSSNAQTDDAQTNDAQSNKTQTNDALLRSALAAALGLLEKPGEVFLGRRKRRGFGECQVTEWRVREWDLTTVEGLLAYLDRSGARRCGPRIAELLYPSPAQPPEIVDRREWMRLRAIFAIQNSILVRSGVGPLQGPDAQHLHRPNLTGSEWTPILPGPTLAGALRSRARRIARTLHPDTGHRLVDRLFGLIPPPGRREGDEPARPDLAAADYPAGRVQVREAPISATQANGTKTLVQTRIRIDRWTGGVLDSLLFEEAPLFGGAQSRVTMDIRLRRPSDAEIGLLLQTLKDLWLADLPLGGTPSVGRGRLVGLSAELTHRRVEGKQCRQPCWRFEQSWDGAQRGPLRFTEGDGAELKTYTDALCAWTPPPSPSDNAAPSVSPGATGEGV